MSRSRRASRIAVALLTPLLFGNLLAAGAEKYPSFGKIERKDPRFDKLVSKDTHMEQLAEGFEWSEGPVWIKDGGYLLFSDIPRNSLMKWKGGEGIKLFMKPSGYTGVVDYGREPGSNGLTLDPQGRVVFCEHGDDQAAFHAWKKKAARKRWSTITRASGSTAPTT